MGGSPIVKQKEGIRERRSRSTNIKLILFPAQKDKTPLSLTSFCFSSFLYEWCPWENSDCPLFDFWHFLPFGYMMKRMGNWKNSVLSLRVLFGLWERIRPLLIAKRVSQANRNNTNKAHRGEGSLILILYRANRAAFALCSYGIF